MSAAELGLLTMCRMIFNKYQKCLSHIEEYSTVAQTDLIPQSEGSDRAAEATCLLT